MSKEFAEMMRNELEMSLMGELNFFLGLQIKKTPTGTMIHQQKYIKELLKKFNMDSSESIDPLQLQQNWTLMKKGKANPKESHLKAVKRILRYLKGGPDLCLWYPRGYNFDLVGHADADYANLHIDMKSTLGTAHFLGSCLVSWGTKKQNSVALSTAEAEYVAATSCCAPFLWIRQ
ncbi:secreted RxLR effector protein 161-like [Nicotiana tabacum]|uniref:Secreted RxLR effector protein 161-like n=1 Tax=Nicotiana tabacum TaxID=4097 RepID=A0AC58SRX0_TOBAC